MTDGSSCSKANLQLIIALFKMQNLDKPLTLQTVCWWKFRSDESFSLQQLNWNSDSSSNLLFIIVFFLRISELFLDLR